MALPTFTPPINPSPGNSFKPQVNLWEADFGDGYSQPTPKGLNHIKQVAPLKWDALLLEQANELERFFIEQSGNKPFYYHIYGAPNVMKWTCKEWEKTQGQDGIWSFSANLVQSFTNAV